MTTTARHVLHANGIILLIDPPRMPLIAKHLPDYLWRPSGSTASSESIINSTINSFNEFYGVHAEERLQSLPIAVMLSKSDLLKYTTPIVPPSKLFSNPVYSLQLDLQDVEIVHKSVKTILEDNKEYELLQAIKNFSLIKLFATSATGCAETEADGNFPYIDPCRCLDPFLWILHILGIIEGRSGFSSSQQK